MAMRNLPRVLGVTAITACVIVSLKLALSSAFSQEPGFLAKAGLLGLACLSGIAVQGLGLMASGVIDRQALLERWRSRKALTISGA